LLLTPAAQMVRLPGGEVTLGFNAEGWQQQQQQQASSATAPCANGRTTAAAAAQEQQRKPLRFGWDNEMPARVEDVASCEMQHRPVCVLEYLWFLAHKLSTAAAAAAGGEAQSATGHVDGSSTGADSSSSRSSSSSRWVVQQFGLEGPLQGLLPQSLHLSTAEATDAAVPPTGSAFSSNAGDAVTSSDSSSSSSSSSALQQQMFAMLQQLLSVKTVYGPVPIRTAGLWPIYCSALQAEEYAAWWDGGSCRLPTEGELLLARQYNADAAGQYSSSSSIGGDGSGSSCRLPTEWELLSARHYNADVDRQYSSSSSSSSGGGGSGKSCKLPTEGELPLARQYNGDAAGRYNDAGGRQYNSSSSSSSSSFGGSGNAAGGLAAVDFNVWHPVNVQLLPPPYCNQHVQQPDIGRPSASAAANTMQQPLISQLTDNGWEWSSTVFKSHAGFQPHPLYPEYSADFFDGKHLVLLGASWATLGGIAGRGSFRNWYQAGQQHVFAKFRLCRNV
jgi:formylglycine-generating enzyme required for sulfatase activity